MAKQILYIADAHIKSRTWANNTRILGDAYNALDKISFHLKHMASETVPDTLVIGGDWFDSNHPTSQDLFISYKFFAQFKNVLFIRGNHDLVYPSFVELYRHCKYLYRNCDLLIQDFLPAESADAADLGMDNDFDMRGLDWTSSRESLLSSLSDIAAAKSNKELEYPTYSPNLPLFLVLHQGFKHLQGIEGTYQLLAEDIETIFSPFKVFVLAGHVHTRDLLKIKNGYIFSPGSLYPTSWDARDNEFSASLIDPVTGDIEYIGCNVRSYYETDKEGMQGVFDSLKEHSENLDKFELQPVVRVHVAPGDSLPDIPSLVSKNVIVQFMTDSYENAAGDFKSDDLTLDQAVTLECGDDPDLAEMAVALMHSDDPALEMAKWLDYWKVEIR